MSPKLAIGPLQGLSDPQPVASHNLNLSELVEQRCSEYDLHFHCLLQTRKDCMKMSKMFYPLLIIKVSVLTVGIFTEVKRRLVICCVYISK